jgi:hypothetical protein
MAVVGEIEHDVLEDRSAFENVGQLTEIAVLREREKPGTSLLAIEAGKDSDPAAAAFEVVGKNEGGSPNAIESSAGPDAKSQHENAEESDATLFEKCPCTYANVLQERFKNRKAKAVTVEFFGLFEAAEFKERLAARFLRAHAGVQVVSDVHLEMALQFFGQLPFAPIFAKKSSEAQKPGA